MKILTPSGFQKFDGVAKFEHNKQVKITFNDDYIITAALDHKFVYDNRTEVFAKNVQIGDFIGGSEVTNIQKELKNVELYSPMNVSNGSVFYHDDFIPSTQTFFGTGDTLFDAECLMNLRARQPVSVHESQALKVYKEPVEDHKYIMTVDVSKGRSQDYSTFNIIDVTTNPFEQVACFRNNKIPPLLFPNIIHKWALTYNKAYVIIEANDQGGVVCNGLYHDLEYEEMHVTSSIKSNGLGIEMNRKIKRLGCAGIKDIVESHKLTIHDEDTIMEMSTFEARGQSYEASDGNHDDLVMNLVMFGYFANTLTFEEMTDVNLKQMMYNQRVLEIDNDLPPFGFIDDGSDFEDELEAREMQDQWFHTDQWNYDKF